MSLWVTSADVTGFARRRSAELRSPPVPWWCPCAFPCVASVRAGRSRSSPGPEHADHAGRRRRSPITASLTGQRRRGSSPSRRRRSRTGSANWAGAPAPSELSTVRRYSSTSASAVEAQELGVGTQEPLRVRMARAAPPTPRSRAPAGTWSGSWSAASTVWMSTLLASARPLQHLADRQARMPRPWSPSGVHCRRRRGAAPSRRRRSAAELLELGRLARLGGPLGCLVA